jgi:hypothetical protein
MIGSTLRQRSRLRLPRPVKMQLSRVIALRYRCVHDSSPLHPAAVLSRSAGRQALAAVPSTVVRCAASHPPVQIALISFAPRLLRP